MASAGWYVIWYVNPGSAGRGRWASYVIVQIANPPKVDSKYKGNTVTEVDGPFLTQALAKKAADQTFLSGIVNGLSTVMPDVKLPNPFSGVAAIGDFFNRLTDPATWVRVGEFALGGVLLYAGIRAMAQGSAVAGAASSVARPVKKVTKTATKTAASFAVPEARLAGRVAAKRIAPKATARVAAHRAQVAKYGAKKPYRPPEPRFVR